MNDCTRPLHGHGLCAAHNIRARRYGDPAAPARPIGRPRDPARRAVRQLLSDWSDATFTRYWAALQSIQGMTVDDSPAEVYAIHAATRANGSMNIAAFVATCRAIRMAVLDSRHVQEGETVR